MKKLSAVLALLSLATIASAQTFVLDTFNDGSQTGSVDTASTWNNNVSLVTNPGALTVSGGATDQSGWAYTFATPVDLSSFNNTSLQLIGQVLPTNNTQNLFITFSDDTGSGFQTFTLNPSLFSSSSLTSIEIPLVWTIDATQIAGWNIGGGNAASNGPAFAFVFDNLAIGTFSTVTPIPEPSTYAAIFGALALGLVAYRRRMVRTA